LNLHKFLLLLVLAIAAFLRLYRIPEYMTFLGDEGRDAIVVRRMLVNGDLALTGRHVVGDIIWALYYYMTAGASSRELPWLGQQSWSRLGTATAGLICGLRTDLPARRSAFSGAGTVIQDIHIER
jgi:hypothetical protein